MNQYVDGVGQLADGSQQLADGSGEAAAGANKLEQGAVDLNTGISKLSTGSVAVTQGTRDVANGSASSVPAPGGTASSARGPPPSQPARPRCRPAHRSSVTVSPARRGAKELAAVSKRHTSKTGLALTELTELGGSLSTSGGCGSRRHPVQGPPWRSSRTDGVLHRGLRRTPLTALANQAVGSIRARRARPHGGHHRRGHGAGLHRRHPPGPKQGLRDGAQPAEGGCGHPGCCRAPASSSPAVRSSPVASTC